jgi:hypothetical protein
MSRRHRWPIVAAVALLPVLYVLSEAPLVKLTGQIPFEGPYGRYWRVYQPVDWLYDETPLWMPLRAWARLWGAEDQIQEAQLHRFGMPWKQPWHPKQ